MRPEAVAGRAQVVTGDALRRVSIWMLAAALSVASAGFAYFRMFGRFAEYDDEGYFMVAVQHLLDGKRLYDDIDMFYGPGYFAYRWLIHGVSGLRVGNDVVRLTSIAMWLATSAMYGVVAHRLCKDSKHAVPLAILAAAFAVMHLRLLAREPGHPQELAGGLVAVALCVSALDFARRTRLVAFCHGLVAGTLILVKANLGLFFGAASLLAWVVDVPWRKAWGRCVLILVGSGALLVPFVLLQARLQDPPAVILCVVVTCALGMSFLHALRSRTDSGCSLGDVVSFTVGAGVAVTVCLVFIVLHGSSLASVFHGSFVAPRQFATALAFTFKCDWRTLAACSGSAVVGIALWWLRRRVALGNGDLFLATVKLAFGAFVLYACLRNPELLVSFGTPWAWLVLIVPGRTISPAEAFLRRLVCLTAVLQVLQVFPVAGSQVHVGTAPLLLVSVTCVADALHAIELRILATRTLATLRAVVLLASASAVGGLGWCAVQDMRIYRQHSNLDFTGCRLTRLPEGQASTYRWLVDNLQASSDTFVSVQGQNSLYSWTGRKPASSIIASRAWILFDEAQQRELVEAHRSRPNVMVVDNSQVLNPGQREQSLFFRFIDQELAPLARVGDYTLMVRRDRTGVALVGCAWWIERDASGTFSEPLPPSLGDPSMRVLRLSCPPGRIRGNVDKVEIVEIAQGLILGSSDSATTDRRVELFDAAGEPLIPGRAGGSTPAELCDGGGGFVLVPESIATRATGVPALRFSKGQERLSTLPIAQRMRRR